MANGIASASLSPGVYPIILQVFDTAGVEDSRYDAFVQILSGGAKFVLDNLQLLTATITEGEPFQVQF